jgi:D-glycero-alpha-D-manno-heptose-7-phosphate kinase
MKTIRAEAPMRVDFAGGTIDLPPLFLFHFPAPTVNIGISIKAKVSITPADEITIVSKDQEVEASWSHWRAIDWKDYPMLELACRLVQSFEVTPCRIEIESEAPAGSGLGGSSVIAIALTAALAQLMNKKLSERQLIEWAKSIETQTIKVPTGYQDYWGAVYGGVHAYRIELNGELSVISLGSAEFTQELEKHLMLVYVGKPHYSAVNNWEMFKQHIDDENGVPEFFENLKHNGMMMQAAFTANDLQQITDTLNEDWRIRKAMLPGMTTPEIEKLTDVAMAAGATALRVCGAGGGGCVLLMVPPGKRSAVETAVKELSMDILPFSIMKNGVSVTIEE